MTDRPKLEDCRTRPGAGVRHVQATFRNSQSVALGPGIVRMVVRYGNGSEQRAAAVHPWPLGAGEAATVVAVVPVALSGMTTHKGITDFAYVESSGAVHPIDGEVKITMFGGARIELES